jgi:hypothetical protein
MMKAIPAVALLMAGSALSSAQMKTWDGFVTDTHCGTNCQRTSDMKPNVECVRLCVRKGSKYGLWYGNHVYVLEPQAEASKFAVKNVRVAGNLIGDVLHITSIVQISQPVKH